MLPKYKYSSRLISLLSLSLSVGLILVPRIATGETKKGLNPLSLQPAAVDSFSQLKFDPSDSQTGSGTPGQSAGGATRFAEPLNFAPPEDQGAPGDSIGGATRGNQGDVCPQDRELGLTGPNLTAVLPDSKQGLTVSGHPAFLVYVPQTSAGEMRFILQDDRDPEQVREIYETTLALPKNLTQTGGLVQIKMPENLDPLEIGKTYTYYATLICSPGDPGGINYDEGFVTRIEVPANIAEVQQNEALSPEQSLWQQAMLYAESGIWMDTVNSLVALMEYEPGNKALENQWMSLLRSGFVNLHEEIAQAKIIHLSDR